MKQDLGRNSEILWLVYSTDPEHRTVALGYGYKTCTCKKEGQYS